MVSSCLFKTYPYLLVYRWQILPVKETILNNALKNRISFTKSSSLQLSVIIVNFNVKYFLEQCLCSVVKAGKNIEMEIIVVDNRSTDNSRDFFKDRFETVKFIWNTENEGFSKANNTGLKQATGEYILFLNPDTILPEDCLQNCLAVFHQHNNIGAVGVHMIDGSGNFLKESKRGFPSPFTSFCKLAGLTALFPTSKIFARYYLGHLDQNKNHEVAVLAGAFMLVQKRVLDKTGGFDERFFMYGEDIDLSYRILQAGFKNFYFAGTSIMHFKGESTKRGSLHQLRQFYGAMSLFAKKHSGRMAGLYTLAIRVIIWIKTSFSGAGRSANRLSNTEKKSLHIRNCFVVGGNKEFDFVKSILQNNDKGLEVVGRVEPHASIGENSLANPEKLTMLIKEHKVRELIFCVNGLLSKDIIRLVQRLPAGIGCWYHFEGSYSIVGSRDKDSAGDYVAIDR